MDSGRLERAPQSAFMSAEHGHAHRTLSHALCLPGRLLAAPVRSCPTQRTGAAPPARHSPGNGTTIPHVMASLPGPASPSLACVSCAKSKTRCDRKVPCTRCVRKKLTCRPRMAQRRAPLPTTTTTATTTTATTTTNSGDSANESTRSHATNVNGVWVDWSHRFDSAWADWSNRFESKRAAAVPAPVGHFPSQPAAHPAATDTNTDGNTARPPPSPSWSGLLNLDLHPPTDTDLTGYSGPFPDTAFALSPGALQDYASNTVSEQQPPRTSSPTPARTDVPSSEPAVVLDAWPLFRCNPATALPAWQSARASFVDNLHALLKDGSPSTGTADGPPPPQSSSSSSPSSTSTVTLQRPPPVEPLLPSSREKVTAVLQGLFFEAQQLYGLHGQARPPQDVWVCPSVLPLPPPAEMARLLRAYADGCASHYLVAPLAGAALDRALAASRTALPSMVLLLSAAVGAMLSPAATATAAAAARGIVDICRAVLGRLMEQDVQLAADPDASQCAWLLVVATVWSGNKWHMDIGMHRKAMYLEMHLRAGHHVAPDAWLAQWNACTDAAERWALWARRERLNRATYAWLFLDYEICLFQDMPSTSLMSVANLAVPIPCPDAALTPDAISAGRDAPHPPPPPPAPAPSLRDCVGYFTAGDAATRLAMHASPTTLRILLCALVDQVLHLRACIDRYAACHQNAHATAAVLLSVQVHEARALLQSWSDLAQAWCPADSAAMCATRILYHLTVLDTMVSFPAVEERARAGPGPGSGSGGGGGGGPPPFAAPSSSSRRPGRAYHLDPEDARDIDVHCGQALRNIRLLPAHARPPWWAGAVYRVALTAWANSRAGAAGPDGAAAAGVVLPAAPGYLQLDVLPAHDPAVEAYRNHQPGGTPVFGNTGAHGSASVALLADPRGILLHCGRLLAADGQTGLAHGIQQKLASLARRWEGD